MERTPRAECGRLKAGLRTVGLRTTTDQRYFVYDGDQMVLVMDAGGAVQNRYLWGAAVDEILADEQVGGELLWTLTDNLGTVRELVNNTSTVRNHIVYDTYGNVLSETAGGTRSAIKFTGRYFDTEMGLQWNLNRWYDAKTGRWLSQDPIGFEGGDGNLYRYVGNDPTNKTDPAGLYWNWGNPFSPWMWDMWYWSDIERESRERIMERSMQDPNYGIDNIRRAQIPGEHERGVLKGFARTGVEANAVILGGGLLRPSAPPGSGSRLPTTPKTPSPAGRGSGAVRPAPGVRTPGVTTDCCPMEYVDPNRATFGQRTLGAAELPFHQRLEAEVIEAMKYRRITSESWELTHLSRPRSYANPDPNLGPNQVGYQAQFFDHVNQETVSISVNYDPDTGLFGIIKESSGP